MKRAFVGALGFIVAFLAACHSAPPPEEKAAPDAAVSRPELGVWGFDIAGQDTSTRPGDSFFRYANGGWYDRTPIPPDKTQVWIDTPTDDLIEARLHELMEQSAARVGHAPDDLDGKVGAFFKSFMDETRIESLGTAPIAPELDAIAKAAGRDDLAALTGRAVRDFEAPYFSVSQGLDQKKPTNYTVYLRQSGLGLPDRNYYLEKGLASEKTKYRDYVEQLLRLASWDGGKDTAAMARRVVDLETTVARASWTREQQRDPDKTYNAMSVDELERFAPGFAWRRLLAEARLPHVTRVVVSEKSAFPELASIWAKTPLDVEKAWAAFHVVDSAAPYLPTAFADAYFDFRGKTLGGQEVQAVRWKRGVLAVAGGDFLNADHFGRFGTMGFGVGQLYTSKYFGADAKTRVTSLVTNLRAAFRDRIEHADWMEPGTKAEAIKKLEAYIVKVGSPDRPRDYTSLRIVDDDLAGNVRRAAEYDWAFELARLDGPVDRTDWFATPQTNNFYNGDLIDVLFPAGALHAPGFDPYADAAINYGGIGSMIGHELTHGFDDAGRKIDATGALRVWWTSADAARFEERAKRLGAQFATYEPLPGLRINGERTMGENIADLGGLTIALDAYRASLGGKPAPVIDGMSGEQRVFLGWAQYWRNKRSEASLRRMVTSNEHSPSNYRVDGIVRNIDAWYDAFKVTPDNKLYLPPDQRVRIW